jgi:SHS2 domain-containing protein
LKIKSYNYNYFDHEADIGIIGRGETLESAFESGAYAMFAIMADIKNLSIDHTIEFSFEEKDPEIAFVTWLNLLIAYGVEKKYYLINFIYVERIIIGMRKQVVLLGVIILSQGQK